MKTKALNPDGEGRLEVSFSFQPKNRRKQGDARSDYNRDAVGKGRVPRVSRLMALAIRFGGLVRRGEVADHRKSDMKLAEIDEMQGKRKADEGAYFSYVTEIGFEA